MDDSTITKPEPKPTYHLGIDPGWVNLGVAVTRFQGGKWDLMGSRTFNPSKMVDATATICSWAEDIIPTCDLPLTYCIERYVSYKGVNTAEAENILMLIGGLREAIGWTLRDEGSNPPLLVRAIDWKTDLVKYLAKNRGFDNPSTSLDKKFSIAAAKCIIGNHEIKTDHEADAICLSAYPQLLRKEASPAG